VLEVGEGEDAASPFPVKRFGMHTFLQGEGPPEDGKVRGHARLLRVGRLELAQQSVAAFDGFVERLLGGLLAGPDGL
jgi:hypothetical protein